MDQESLKVKALHDTLGFALLTTEDPGRGKAEGVLLHLWDCNRHSSALLQCRRNWTYALTKTPIRTLWDRVSQAKITFKADQDLELFSPTERLSDDTENIKAVWKRFSSG
ncbi:hypothetical protein RRG08_040002 [Elysia crispata]|uniref:Uncharacterized protein n=1 Tax=Elysia crispata TaxID=231223 RepID=A0AAE0Z8R8_9GAST|nr:hypothetical protein RRG08_040002 [Elysia crispata]